MLNLVQVDLLKSKFQHFTSSFILKNRKGNHGIFSNSSAKTGPACIRWILMSCLWLTEDVYGWKIKVSK